MAAAIIPLITETIPIIVPLIKSIIGHVSPHVQDPAVLHQTVTDSVTPIVKALATSGVLPNELDPQALSGAIQVLIHEMSPTPTPIASPLPDVIIGQDDGGNTVVSAGPAETIFNISGAKIIVSGTLTLQKESPLNV